MPTWIEDIWQDVRFALRGLRRNPGFTAVAVLSLALGIGANTAIFSLVETVMLRPLAVHHPEQLVELLQQYPGEPRGSYWSQSSYEHIRDNNHFFSAITGLSIDNRLPYTMEGFEPEYGIAEYVLGNYFSELGVTPVLGQAVSQGGVVVSYALWTNRFHRDPGILGKRVLVRDVPWTIVGVAPADYTGLRVEAQTDLWFPRTSADSGAALALVGRLKPGATIEQAGAELAVLQQFAIEERAAKSKDPNIRKITAQVEPAGAGLHMVRDMFGKALVALMGIVGLLLLLTCVNLAGMLLARGAGREREMALRTSLGASRGRLLRQVLTESFVLSLAGTAVGIGFAYFGTSTLLRILASGRLHERVFLQIRPDWRILTFAVAIALLTGLLFGLPPALGALRQSSNFVRVTGNTRERRIFGKALVALQVALSVVLLSGAALFVGHVRNLEQIDLGFRRDHVLLVSLDASRSGYSNERLAQAYRELLARLASVPGVRSIAVSAPTPLSGAGASAWASTPGFVEQNPDERKRISIAWASPQYFETLGTPLLAGRDFAASESTRVAIVNQRFAHYYFGDSNPIGKQVTLDHITMDREAKTFEIVGVAGDANYFEIRESAVRTIYLPAFQEGRVTGNNLVVRTELDPGRVSADVRRVIHEVAPAIPVSRMTTLEDQINSTIVPERMIATLTGFFGVLGAVLAGIGLHGLLAYTVARRTNEIGIRMALGATRGRVVGMILRESLAMVAAGLAMGIPAAIAGCTLAMTVIPASTVTSWMVPLTIGGLAILGVALFASYSPASRAAGVDPMVALRHD